MAEGNTSRSISCVAAMALNRGIGINNKLPWPSLKTDLEFLERITTGVNKRGKWNAVLLGVRTWESLDSSQRPLPGRLNVVISTSRTVKTLPPGANFVCDSVLAAVNMLSSHPFASTVENIFALGGTEVYREAIESPFCHRIYLTEIKHDFEADRFFPEFDTNVYKCVSSPADVPRGVFVENNIQYSFSVYERQDYK